ncbi:MAG: alpha/beta hydrolase [Pseudomonadota bacterium]
MSRSNQPTVEMQAALDMLTAEFGELGDGTLMPISEGRAQSARTHAFWNRTMPEVAMVEPIELGVGEPGTLFVPHNDEGRGAILYIHGGGWAFCSAATHEGVARSLAVAAGAPVATFDYRLAPEHPFPAGLDDCRTAWAAFRRGMDRPALGVAGDSAGANLSLATLLADGPAEPAAIALLFYGVFGTDFETPSARTHAEAPGLTTDKMRRFFDWYVPADRHRDPLVAPVLASDAALTALPPLFINAAGIDPLRSDSEMLHARLAALGRADEFVIHEGVIHGFMLMGAVLEEARVAMQRAGDAFKRAAKTTA